MNTLKSKLFVLTLLLIGVVAMSFTWIKNDERKVEPKQDDLHWFQINASYDDDEPVSPGDATYINSDEMPPAGTGCTGTEKQCVSGFTTNQTTVIGGVRVLDGAQLPVEVASYKNQ